MSTADRKGSPMKVYARQRPLLRHEIDLKCWSVVHSTTPREITIRGGTVDKKYNFDQVFGEAVTQFEIYNRVVAPMISNIISGYNCTVFLYGQSGTGKTYTMLGPNPINPEADLQQDPFVGLIPRASEHLFLLLSKLNPQTDYTARMSLIEIYNEEVRDLLNGSLPLRIYDDPLTKGSICLKDLSKVTVFNTRDVFDWLSIGITQRQNSATNLNLQSSRSHLLFTFLINTREQTPNGEEIVKTGRLHLVDLAGSENASRSAALDVRARETATVNKSLLTLGKVIKDLGQKMVHIPYRDSKLTRILQDSLGGNSKTSMIVTFSPSSNAWDETVSSFDVGTLARNVINFPLVDVNKKQANFLKELEDKICHLKGELWAATFREGLYVSAQTYEKMTQDVKVNNEKILDLIREIRELEEHMLSRESQYRSLNESFEKTNRYLESSRKALKEKEEVVKKDKDRVDHLVERQEELVNSANILMDVCKNTTKEVEIYHKKYQDKCNTNINNAKLSEDMLSLCARCMKEIKNTAEHYTQSQSTQVSKVQEANQTLQNDHVNNLDRMKQFSLDIQDKFKSYNLNSDELFKSDVKNFDGQNIEKFVSDTYENSISHLQNRGEIADSLDELRNYFKRKNTELENGLKQCLNIVNANMTQKEQTGVKITNQLEHIKKEIKERKTRVEGRIEKEGKFISVLKTELLDAAKEEEECTAESLVVEQRMKEMMELIKQNQRNQQAARARERVNDYVQNLSTTVTSHKAAAESARKVAEDNEANLRKQALGDKNKVKHFVTQMTGAVNKNLGHRSLELKKDMLEWEKRIDSIKEDVAQAESGCTQLMEYNMRLITQFKENCNATVQQFVQHSIDYLKTLQDNVDSTGHAGDTPVKKTYIYPKNVPKSTVDATLLSQELSEKSEPASKPDPEETK